MKKILIVGSVYDKHAYRFISHLKKEDNSLKIDILSYEKKEEQPECIEFCEKVYQPQEARQKLYKIKYLGQIIKAIDFKHDLKSLALQKKNYDAVFVLWVFKQNIFAANIYKKLSKNIILVPLGSDVLRISKLVRLSLIPFYQKANYIVLPKTGFKQVVQKYFKIKESQIVNLGFGSDMIDAIEESNLSKEDAKKELKIIGKFVITIGYNAVEAQNHLKVIKEIDKIRTKLPQNLLLLFPMSYPSTPTNVAYRTQIKEYLRSRKYDFIMLENYLSEEDLLLYRKCTDIFIHAQRTDASCSSIQEYLLANCTVLNAAWLQYPQLEKYEKPYFTFNHLEDIGECLIKAITIHDTPHVNQLLKEEIYKRGWKSEIKLWVSFINSIK